MKKVATTGCTLTVEPSLGSLGVGGAATLVSGYSIKTKVGGFVLLDGATFSVIGVTAPGGYTQPAPALGTIPASATKVRSEGSPVILEGDSAEVNVPLVQVSSGTPMQVSMTVKVQVAGQLDVRAN